MGLILAFVLAAMTTGMFRPRCGTDRVRL